MAKRRSYGNAQKPRGYWAEWENVEKEIKAIVAAQGELPGAQWFEKHGHSSLYQACIRRYGGMTRVRERAGLVPLRRQNGWADDVAEVDRQLREVIETIGSFPTAKQLKDSGRGDLLKAVLSHGGLIAARRRLGAALRATDVHSWQTEEQVLTALRPLVERLGRMPTSDECEAAGLMGMRAMIYGRFDMQGIATKLGVGFKRNPPGTWREPEFFRAQLDEAIKAIGHFPSHEELVRLGKATLSKAIIRYHGGYEAVRESSGHGKVVDAHIIQYADALTDALLRLRPPDTQTFWENMKARWSRRDLDIALEDFRRDGSVERFRALLADD